MHSVITAEAASIVHDFTKKINSNGGIVQFRNTFSLSNLNVLWCMVAGTRYSHNDPRLGKLLDNIFKLSKSCSMGNPFELLVPFLAKIAPGILKERQDVFDEIHMLSRVIRK